MAMREQIFIVNSPAQTKRLGALLAKEILTAGPIKFARILALFGELGSGKTNFTQGFAKGLGIKEKVNSPTFSIIKKYSLPIASGFSNFYHFDCYRLNLPDDLILLGAKEIFSGDNNIIVVEWPKVAASFLPKKTNSIFFESIGKRSRRILIQLNL